VCGAPAPAEEEGSQQPPGLVPASQKAAPAAALGRHHTAVSHYRHYRPKVGSGGLGGQHLPLGLLLADRINISFKKEENVSVLLTRLLALLSLPMLLSPFSGPGGGHRNAALFPRA